MGIKARQWMIFLIICFSQKAVLCAIIHPVFLTDLLNKSATHILSINSKQETNSPSFATAVPSANDYGAITLTILGVVSGLATIYDVFDRAVLPQPTTVQDTFEIVKRVEDLARPNDEEQYKHVEDTIFRAKNDLNDEQAELLANRNSSNNIIDQVKILGWLERARRIDGDVILLMDGLLGRQVASVDLMQNIKVNLKCNATLIKAKITRYNNLIENGTKVFFQFAQFGQMSQLELSRRKAAFGDRQTNVIQRREKVVEDCYEQQLKRNIQDDPEATTDQVAENVTQALSHIYPGLANWIVGVYADEKREQMGLESRASVQPVKSKHSAHYNIKNISGYSVALYQFPYGTKPKMIDGNSVDVFCNRPVIGAGGKSTCDVGSSDGQYVYDELRRLDVVPDSHDLIVVPVAGKLSVKTIPIGNFPSFFSKHYPDFDIIIF